MLVRLATRLALLAILIAAFGVAANVGRGARAATEIELDTYRANDSSPILAMGPILEDGQQYTITIVGTFSYWFASDWQNQGVCNGATPEDAPIFMSPGTTNGPVGDDAAWHFAGPNTFSDCDGPFPDESTSLEISLDGGATSNDLVVDDPGNAPNPNHSYHHTVVGQGDAVVFRFEDEKTVDNYGIFKFTIDFTPPLTWGDNNCSGAHDPFDALATLVDESGIQASDCPNIGAQIETASFGTRMWGDLNCSGAFDAPDVLLLLRDAAGLPPANLQDCPALGIEIALAPG